MYVVYSEIIRKVTQGKYDSNVISINWIFKVLYFFASQPLFLVLYK